MVDSTAAQAVSHGAGSRGAVWTWAAILLCLLCVTPILSIFVAAAGDTGGLWSHLFSTVLPRYVVNTLGLMVGVTLVSLAFGVPGAWAVSRYDFPGRRLFEWMLLLPAAVPAYLIAYTYTDFLEYAGPVQGGLREVFGWASARDYWFPEIRSLEGASLVMGAVLYPYVYLMARTAFSLTPASLFEAARLANRNLFWSVALPIARPAIVAGLALVLMETISDFGTVEYFAVETLTLGIFNVWLGMNSLTAAAQIASLAFLFVLALLVMERYARSRRQYSDTGRKAMPMASVRPGVSASVWCVLVCLLPIVVGFVVPVGVLLSFVLRGYSLSLEDAALDAVLNSLLVAGSSAGIVMAVAALIVFVSTYRGGRWMRIMAAMASVGYAFPGTILAIGVVTSVGALDTGISAAVEAVTGVPSGALLSSGVGLVIFACTVRFMAVGYGAITTGVQRLPPNMMNASRVLGHGFASSFRHVILPLVRTSILAGGMLVFVDVMKELPMTLLLRPFNFETMATHVYQYAKDELLEEAALPALMIVAAGIGPVVLMNAALRRIGAR
ncbi:MAG: iron ABC transporter permease [Alphaproteobacteria bacterium]|nr:iron ABC transporter permease [Alphaproteobacteria bacterium]